MGERFYYELEWHDSESVYKEPALEVDHRNLFARVYYFETFVLARCEEVDYDVDSKQDVYCLHHRSVSYIIVLEGRECQVQWCCEARDEKYRRHDELPDDLRLVVRVQYTRFAVL